MRNNVFTLITILLLAAVLSACSGVAAAQGPTPVAPAGQVPPRTLSVSGTGQANLTPDIAYVTIGVHSEGPDASDAATRNSTQTQTVVDAIKKFGIEAKDIRTTNFSIYPQQQYDMNGRPSGEITYMVDNSVYVTVRDLGKVGELLDVAVKAGANSISGIQFDVANRTAALAEARAAAIANARGLAQEMAKAAGVELGDIQAISLNTGGYPGPMYDMGYGGKMAEAAASVPISPGQMTLTVDVSVVYTIR